ncbi:MAG: nucleotidyltransferase domain-containing protein [Candidatus Aenigmatarchaeota archaeon]
MTEQTRKALAFVSNYLTFFFLERTVEDKIISAYLFGSAVRGELSREGDIDMFLNCTKKDEETVLKASRIAESRFRRSKDFDKWRQLDFDYHLSIKAGPLEEWELKGSIESEGIELFSTSFQPEQLERMVIFILDLPKKKSSYLSLTRELFGRRENGYKKEGVVNKKGGERLGSNTFHVPKSAQQIIITILHRHKTSYKMLELFKK